MLLMLDVLLRQGLHFIAMTGYLSFHGNLTSYDGYLWGTAHLWGSSGRAGSATSPICFDVQIHASPLRPSPVCFSNSRTPFLVQKFAPASVPVVASKTGQHPPAPRTQSAYL